MTRLAEYWGLVPLADLERAADELGRGELDRASGELDRLIDQASESTILLYSEPRPGAIPIEQAYKEAAPKAKPDRSLHPAFYWAVIAVLTLHLWVANREHNQISDDAEGQVAQDVPYCRPVLPPWTERETRI